MRYSLEELAPVTAKLAKKYNGCDSTSMTYERAGQLMEAVLYCIRELESQPGEYLQEKEALPPQRAYELGLELVRKKAGDALLKYHRLLEIFDDYGNRCLRDTVICGIPEFFRRYDAQFAPQETILTMDYPVGRDLSGLQGVDAIDAYIEEIYREQKYLGCFLRQEVLDALAQYHPDYGELIENLAWIFKTVS